MLCCWACFCSQAAGERELWHFYRGCYVKGLKESTTIHSAGGHSCTVCRGGAMGKS